MRCAEEALATAKSAPRANQSEGWELPGSHYFCTRFWRLRPGVSLVSLVCFVLAGHSWYILVATVMSAIWNITRDHPAVTQRVWVDDRS